MCMGIEMNERKYEDKTPRFCIAEAKSVTNSGRYEL